MRMAITAWTLRHRVSFWAATHVFRRFSPPSWINEGCVLLRECPRGLSFFQKSSPPSVRAFFPSQTHELGRLLSIILSLIGVTFSAALYPFFFFFRTTDSGLDFRFLLQRSFSFLDRFFRASQLPF